MAPTSRHALFFLDLESSSRLEHLGDSIRFGASSTVATVLAAGAEVASFELQWMPELPCAYYGEVDATQRLVHTGRLAGHAVVRQLTAGARVKRARREVLLVPTPAESGDGIADEEAAAPAAEVAAERPTLAGGKRERDPPQGEHPLPFLAHADVAHSGIVASRHVDSAPGAWAAASC